jgi:putative effector of murein hydrolase
MSNKRSLLLSLSCKLSQILKVVLVASLGFLYTLTTVTYSVLAVRAAAGASPKAPASAKTLVKKTALKAAPVKPYSDVLANGLGKVTLIAGIVSLLATSQGFAYDMPLRTIFLGSFTFYAYVFGARLPPTFTKIVHPLVTSAGILLGSCALLAKMTGVEFLDYLRYYKSGSLSLTKAGPGDVLLYLLGPSVVSFAISMYSRRALLKSNLLVVVTAMLVSSVGGLFGTAAFVRAISLGGKGGSMVRLSVLARNVTTALSMALTAMIGGDISIAASVVVLTGIIGATYGKSLLTYLGIHDPIVRGLAIGCSSQGLGVASISDEPDAFPFAAISMVLTAVSATTLVSIPVVKDALIKLATGA